MTRRSSWPLWLSLAAVVTVVCGFVTLMVTFAQQDGGTQEAGDTKQATEQQQGPAPAGPTKPETAVARRVPVSGAAGFFVVINPDGSSYMEAPDGKQTKLTDPDPATAPDDSVVDKVVGRMTTPLRKTEVGQLIVCDRGVVDVPKGAIITFVGTDKVVTHNPDGSSTAYFTDGRVVQRDRTDRRSEGRAASKEP